MDKQAEVVMSFRLGARVMWVDAASMPLHRAMEHYLVEGIDFEVLEVAYIRNFYGADYKAIEHRRMWWSLQMVANKVLEEHGLDGA